MSLIKAVCALAMSPLLFLGVVAGYVAGLVWIGLWVGYKTAIQHFEAL